MDPLQRLTELYREAQVAPCHDPTAMTLATVGADGRPSARIVLCKGVDNGEVVFYTNTNSRKGREIAANSNVALTFWWPHLGWQVRIEGRAALVSDEEADAYFATRARGSQLGAWASSQSEPLATRAELHAKMAELTARYGAKPVPRPPHWTGYRVVPVLIELWQNRQDRLHERDLYTRSSPSAPWQLTLLNP
jgi:pyridoxamine 5'-phosphate oxidase